MAKPNLIEPGARCAPCIKEIICGSKAQANIRAGHALFEAGAWTEEEAMLWNAWLDRFIAETNALLAAKMRADGEAEEQAGEERP